MFIAGCPGFSDDAAYGAMDFLLEALEEIGSEVFWSVAHLLDLDVDIIFVDTTSTYWELEVAAELPRSPMARTVTMITCRRRRGPDGSGTPRTTATTCRRR